jgi:hypothetical protein
MAKNAKLNNQQRTKKTLCKLFIEKNFVHNPRYFWYKCQKASKEIDFNFKMALWFSTTFFFVFYSGRDASHPEILVMIHSYCSCRPSGNCEGSRDRTSDCSVAVWCHPVALDNWATTSPQLSHHIPTTEPPHPLTEPPHPLTEPPHPQLSHHIFFILTNF